MMDSNLGIPLFGVMGTGITWKEFTGVSINDVNKHYQQNSASSTLFLSL